MNRRQRKRDRTARLLRLQILLGQYPDGLKIEELAQKCRISERTVYRDLEALESELGVPLWEEGRKRGVAEGYFLPPITFTGAEAMNIFLSARLMNNYLRRYDPGIVSTFIKLGSIVPPPLRKQIQNTVTRMEKLPRDERKIDNFNKLAQAWLSQHRVRIRYQELSDEEPGEHLIEPYFIEPAMPGYSSYVIAYSHLKKSIYTFKIDRIIGDVQVESNIYEIPPDFNAVDYLGSAWTSYASAELETVKLHFNPKISKAVMETTWHPSQTIEPQADGSLIMTLKVHITIDFRAWVLGWAELVEVLEPQTLRNQMIEITRAFTDIYIDQK